MWIVMIAILAKLIVQWGLNALNLKKAQSGLGQIPESLLGLTSPEDYQKSSTYTIAKLRFSQFETIFDHGFLILVLISGVLPQAWNALAQRLGTGAWAQAWTLLMVTFALGMVSLPWEWWQQFRLEARFGFNRSTLGLWVMDKIKHTAISVVFGLPLIYGILRCFEKFGDTWWLWGFGLFMSLQTLMLVIYPMWIMPLFNRFEPLTQGPLKERLMALAQKTQFPAREILVMDGSRRSGHSNAFFTGLGKIRRIVLFDTLVEQLKPEELEAVLAHEIGHYRRGHIRQRLILSAVMSFLGFGILAYCLKLPAFYETFGFAFNAQAGNMGPGLLLFSLLSGVAGFWIQPLINASSRCHEYQADAFAAAASGPGALSRGRCVHE